MFRQHHFQKLYMLVMSSIMSLTLSLVFMVVEGGFDASGSISSFIVGWLTRALQTWVVVLPVVMLISPLARKIATALVRAD